MRMRTYTLLFLPTIATVHCGLTAYFMASVRQPLILFFGFSCRSLQVVLPVLCLDNVPRG